MEHGVAGYFAECKRFNRRISALTIGVSVVLLGSMFIGPTDPARRGSIDPLRFGFEGPERYVRRVTLEARGPTNALADVGKIHAQTRQERGGSSSKDPRGIAGLPEPTSRTGAGSSALEMAVRSASRSAGVPVFQSEELIIDRLVRPGYPPALLEQNVEGKVTLQAMVDTVGNVIDVVVLASTGETQFELAAAEAVRKCRFRPYRPTGEASEFYAVFRFSFRIY